jgi:serine/threonine protein kinase
MTERQFYACKVVPKSLLSERELTDRFKLEIDLHRGLSHPGIVRMVDLSQDSQNFYLFMEFCSNGELFQYIVDREKLREEEAKTLLLQILVALDYIHTNGIVHRDLKPENILFDQYGRLKIADFGLSRFAKIGDLSRTPCGSPCYASPELLSGRPYDGRTNDLWGVGVILFAMVTGQLPWTKRNQTQLFQQIRNGEYTIPPYLSTDCANMIGRLLTVDPAQRITVQQAIQHPFLARVQLLQSPVLAGKQITQELVDRSFGRAPPKPTIAQPASAALTPRRKSEEKPVKPVIPPKPPSPTKPPITAPFHGGKRARSGAGLPGKR